MWIVQCEFRFFSCAFFFSFFVLFSLPYASFRTWNIQKFYLLVLFFSLFLVFFFLPFIYFISFFFCARLPHFVRPLVQSAFNKQQTKKKNGEKTLLISRLFVASRGNKKKVYWMCAWIKCNARAQLFVTMISNDIGCEIHTIRWKLRRRISTGSAL